MSLQHNPMRSRPAPRSRHELTWWHTAALQAFRGGANTVGIAKLLKTTEADAYNLLAQAREVERMS